MLQHSRFGQEKQQGNLKLTHTHTHTHYQQPSRFRLQPAQVSAHTMDSGVFWGGGGFAPLKHLQIQHDKNCNTKYAKNISNTDGD